MKKIVLFLLCFGVLFAQRVPHKYELIHLPHPMKTILNNGEKLQLSDQQRATLEAILQEVPTAMLDDAQAKEKHIHDAILYQLQSKETVDKELDELMLLKRRITNMHIDILNQVQKILNETQYKQMLEIYQANHSKKQ